MINRVRRVAPVIGLAVAALVSTTPTADASASGPQRSVTIQLVTSHGSALRALARARHLAPAARRHQLQQDIPSADTRARVAALLSTHGLSVTHETPFTVTATGPAAAVHAAFAAHANGLHSTATLAPGILAGLATSVIDDTVLKGALKPALTPTLLNATTARQIYDTTDGTPPAGDASPAIATLQFSGWNNGDMTAYAAQNALSDPVASGQYRAISIDGASPFAPDGNGGEQEVALDQETLLAVAPHAPQRAYFAPNSAQGEFDALEQVATDALNANIGALSISWGDCEADQFGVIAPIEAALSDVLAAGVTVFASTGDSGAFDCVGSPGLLAVDYPASDPLVVGVGGVTVDATDPSAPQEQVWWDGLNGSGGGISDAFNEPDYQTVKAPGLTGRGVPDIALDGDPASGFEIFADGTPMQVGGTSLATPLAAATLVNLLSTNGVQGGVGDIHSSLYGAPATSLRDVSVGDNGAYVAGPGYDEASGLGAPLWQALAPDLVAFVSVSAPAYSRSHVIPIAATGTPGVVYSGWTAGVGTEPTSCPAATAAEPPTTVTAPADGTKAVWVVGFVDAVCYIADAITVVDTVAPTVTVSATRPHANTTAVTFHWSGGDAAPSSGIAHYAVTITHNGSSTADYSSASTTSTAKTLTGARGKTYTVSVTAADAAGNGSARRSATVAVPFDDRSLHYSTHWSHASASSAYLRTIDVTSTRGAKAGLTAVGRSFSVVVDTCSTCGHLTEYVDGHKLRTVSLVTSRSQWAKMLSVARFAKDGRHTVAFVAAGGVVKLDGLAVTV